MSQVLNCHEEPGLGNACPESVDRALMVPAQCQEPGVKSWGCAGCGLEIRQATLWAGVARPGVGLGWGDTDDCVTVIWADGSPHAGWPSGRKGDGVQLQELLGKHTSTGL